MSDDYLTDDDFNAAIDSGDIDIPDPFEDEVQLTDHALEGFFDVEPNSTEVVRAKFIFKELVKHEEYDDKDDEIENDIQMVYKLALEAYKDTMKESNMDDPKGKAAMVEQASSFLNTALQAAKEKSSQKQAKDKNKLSREKIKNDAGKGANDLLTMDRNQLLRMLKGEEPETLDGEFTEESE